MVDEEFILEKPSFFYAVGQGYHCFNDLSDEDTSDFIEKWGQERKKRPRYLAIPIR